jgi:hypothetical protein
VISHLTKSEGLQALLAENPDDGRLPQAETSLTLYSTITGLPGSITKCPDPT